MILRWVVLPEINCPCLLSPQSLSPNLRMIFGELPLAMVVLVDFAIKLVWLTSLIALGLMTITNACYLVIFDTMNNSADAKIVTTLKIVSTVASVAILMLRQFLLVRLKSMNASEAIFG